MRGDIMMTRKRKRPARIGEVICKCGSYKFPHRLLGGDCDGSLLVSKYFEMHLHSDCRDCHFRSVDNFEVGCEILDGLEPALRCPGLVEYVQFNEVKLYGHWASYQKRKGK